MSIAKRLRDYRIEVECPRCMRQYVTQHLNGQRCPMCGARVRRYRELGDVEGARRRKKQKRPKPAAKQ